MISRFYSVRRFASFRQYRKMRRVQ